MNPQSCTGGPGMLRTLLVSGERASLVAAVSRGLPSVHEEQNDAKKASRFTYAIYCSL